LFGPRKTIVFSGVFFSLSLLVHLVYRVKTKKWTQGWLDFVVIEEKDEIRAEKIGKFYYSFVIFNVIISLVASQVLF